MGKIVRQDCRYDKCDDAGCRGVHVTFVGDFHAASGLEAQRLFHWPLSQVVRRASVAEEPGRFQIIPDCFKGTSIDHHSRTENSEIRRKQPVFDTVAWLHGSDLEKTERDYTDSWISGWDMPHGMTNP